MLSTIERVIALKSARLFNETPDGVLAEVSALMEPVDMADGEPIIVKGDVGDSLYVIVSGSARVHDGDRELATIGEGGVFGEMALLDSEPRSASVTANGPTRLLRLDQEQFYALLEQRPEITAGLIRTLANTLRERLRDLAGLDAELQQVERAAADAPDAAGRLTP